MNRFFKKISVDLGWYGAGAILVAYALLSFSVLSASSLIYQLLNLTGALGILVDTYYKKDTPPEVLNIIWSVIALIAIFRIVFIH